MPANQSFPALADESFDAHAVLASAKGLIAVATGFVATLVVSSGRIDNAELTRNQRGVHGLAWASTLVEAMRHLLDWSQSTSGGDEITDLVFRIGFADCLDQLLTRLQIGPNEFVRPADLGVEGQALQLAAMPEVRALLAAGNTRDNRQRLADLLAEGQTAPDTLDDDLDMIRTQFRRFAEKRIQPHAHQWHLDDLLIPDDIIREMADLGVFGICIPQEYGGLGMGKLAMCVVTEELSRAWITAGSLGTRSEIAGDLIAVSGTTAQKEQWLGGIASGAILPAAVFTEPDTGSDLAHLKTRAIKTEQGWSVNGAKTWITHAARSDLMTILVRTDPDKPGHGGLSMLLAAKPRGTADDSFPVEGLSGGEIEVLGYRGMKEYQLSFDGFEVATDALLGGTEGQGFAQLMQTFEGARIQTAARAVGVARRAFELGLSYALDRRQFGAPIITFPRVSDKLALSYVEMIVARELTYFAARRKDLGQRCDIQAGMAKLLAARVAWSNADAALQIHGGNGYALEFEISRILCDARILGIFEGASEIQAHVIGRGLIAASLGSG